MTPDAAWQHGPDPLDSCLLRPCDAAHAGYEPVRACNMDADTAATQPGATP
jgi:hypothetical protein